MKVFVLPAIYPTAEFPQLGIYVQEHCLALKKYYGYEFIVINATTTSYKNWHLANTEKKFEDNVGFVYQKYTKGVLQSRLPRYAIWSYRRNVIKLFDEAIKEHGIPEMIYAHFSFPSGYVAMELARRYKIPFVVDEHYSLYYSEKIHPVITSITRETVDNANAFLCVSYSLKGAIEKHIQSKKNISVIPNLVNDRYCYSANKENDEFVFFSAGNFYKIKNFPLLITAFSEAFTKTDKVKLRIAGSGEQEPYLKELIQKYGREDQIILVGRLDSDQMLLEYERCNCFALLSKHETFGIVYREALASGRPIIATRNGGIEEDWDEQYGILLDNDSIECAAEALKKMRDSYQSYNSNNISEICRKHYSEAIIAGKVDAILKKCIKEYRK